MPVHDRCHTEEVSGRHYTPPAPWTIVVLMTNPTDTTPRPAVTADSADQADAVISALGLSCTYGDFTAVDGVDLTVRRGELYALLGTNGAGKTTTLEVLEGHRAASAGRVEVFGGDPADRRRTRRRTGMMLQDSGLAPELTVRESVLLSGAVSGRDDDVDRVLGLVGIDHKSSARVAQLSGGERRRVDFAAAVWGTPELVFLDEPTTGLDPAARDALWAVVSELREAGVTFLLTTHYLEEAAENADRIGLMHAGTIRREGTIADLTAGSTTSIRFVAPRPIDELPLRVTRTENDLVVVETDDPQRDVTALMTWAADADLTLARLSVHESGLDDVFRDLSRSA
jgi:ABC-2 type transport system ATP-binding protein